MKDTTDLIARIFISMIFLFEAYDSIAFFKSTKSTMTDYGITWQQDMLLGIAIFLLILGGVLVLIGYRSGFGATLLLIYWIPVTFITHTWWNDPDLTQREESVEFMKNIAIIGALLLIMVNGSGRYSIRRLFATTIVKR
jgi:putative oxidoreductase